MTFTQRDFIKSRTANGTPHVLVDAVHAAPPKSDAYTGEIAEAVAEKTGCHCIIATVSRTVADLNRCPDRTNREAVTEYRVTLTELLRSADLLNGNGALGRPFLHLALHGMQNRGYMDIEFGTAFGDSCSMPVLDHLADVATLWTETVDGLPKTPRLATNQELWGDRSLAAHRQGEGPDYPGYGPNFNTIQIEVAHWLRAHHRDHVVGLLVRLIKGFPSAFR